jgi:hypothetical protein
MLFILRVGAICITASLLAACVTTRDSYVSNANAKVAGDWRIETAVDPITRKRLASAFVTTLSSHSLVPYPQAAMLQLTCFDNERVVRFSFETKVGSNRNSVLGYRFDENSGRETKARFLQNDRIVMLEDRAEVEQFTRELATAKVVHIRIRSMNTGRSTADFRVNGAPAAIEAAFAECAPRNDPPTRRMARKR